MPSSNYVGRAQSQEDSAPRAEEVPVPFSNVNAGAAAAYVGHATVGALLHPRLASEGPVLVLDNPEFDAVCGCTEIPSGAAGVMAFDVGPVILARAVWVDLASCKGPQVECAGPMPPWRDARIGYVVKSPIAYERFIVVGKSFGFTVRAGQPGWKPVADLVRDEAISAHLPLRVLG